MKYSAEGERQAEKGWEASTRTMAVGTRAKEGEARERIAADKERRDVAAARGDTEYDTALPDTFPYHTMDYEGRQVFEASGGRKDQYAYYADRTVANDPVARLFARIQALEFGNDMYTRQGIRIRMDEGNKKILKSDDATDESGKAMRVAMDIHAAVHFTDGWATDGSKAEGRLGETAFGAWGERT